jgi:hypothetical protein
MHTFESFFSETVILYSGISQPKNSSYKFEPNYIILSVSRVGSLLSSHFFSCLDCMGYASEG